MTQKKLYALVVGIHTYNFPPQALNRCVQDAKRVAAYLEQLLF